MANSFSFNQVATILTAIAKQATGIENISVTDTSSFVTVAQKTLSVGYDPIYSAINQVIAKTIFSNRAYSRKFGGLMVDQQKWGAVTRKISFGDTNPQTNDEYNLTDGGSVDPFKVSKAKPVQYNFFGRETYKRADTTFENQLDVAFRGPDEFAAFLAAKTQNIYNQREQDLEIFARGTVANLIGGVISKGKQTQIVHLLTEYNAITGLALTDETVYQPENFVPFMKWVYSRIAAVSSLLSERSNQYHFDVTGDPVIMRHTPENRQKVYLYAPTQYQISAQVLADVYHDNYLRYADHENVNYWQAIQTPDTINVTPSVLDPATGNVTKAEAVNQANIFGVIFDEEAAGMTETDTAVRTQVNAAGRYTNTFWFYTFQNWNDFTENAVVFLLD